MIPLVHLLSEIKEFEVILGISGSSGEILKSEFPRLKAFQMPAFNITYSSRTSQAGKIFFQLPKIIKTTLAEHFFLKNLIREEQIACVISDHRYGLFNKNLLSILIIHQLKMKFPPGLKAAEKLFNRFQRVIFRRFDQIWVPDFPGKDSIAGSLAHPPSGLDKIFKIGILSRFLPTYTNRAEKLEVPYDITVVLSGPEPQRSMLEKTLIPQLETMNKKVLFVRGVPGDEGFSEKNGITYVTRLSTPDMADALALTSLVICRSGYSSVMDLLALGKRAVLIPTPGQPEQEYLAGYLRDKGYFFSQKQSELDIQLAISASREYTPPTISGFSETLYERLRWLKNRLEKYEGEHQYS
jgi:hypothetical protein